MANPTGPTIAEQESMTSFLIGAVIRDATGEADGDRCVGEPPSARYYLAALAPHDLDLSAGEGRRGRETPSSLGFEFEVDDPSAALEAEAHVSVYYRVYPSFEEQIGFHAPRAGDLEDGDQEFRLAPIFRRIEVNPEPFRWRLDPNRPGTDLAETEFSAALGAAVVAAASDPWIYKRESAARPREAWVPRAALVSEQAFEDWCRSRPGKPLLPSWSGKVAYARRSALNGGTRVTVYLVNASVDPKVAVIVRGEQRERHDDDRDHFFFRCGLKVRPVEGRITPIRMDLGPDAYRYDPRLAAYAANCGVEPDMDADAVSVIRSVPAPVHSTRRIAPRIHDATSFELLQDDPLHALEQLAADLEAYSDDPSWSTAGMPVEQAQQKETDQKAFALEVARFKEGVRWLKRDPRLLLALRLTNRSMIKLGLMTGKRYPGWRLFQIVFLVSQLPALAWREHDPAEFTPGLWGADDGDPTAAVSVLWFPTGGGKTEAYLGLTVCAMFYDRARGKGRGVTAWCRFPLRLLSLQQTQRQLAMVVAAEEVRKGAVAEIRAVGGTAGDPFALGFYVGGSNALPGQTSEGGSDDVNPERLAERRVVDECPYCGKRAIEIPQPDPTDLRMVHRCAQCGRILPVYVRDNEIYRYLPALVVGTVDKLAIMGLTDRFGALLGDVDCECSLHGLGRGMKCHERRMKGHPDDALRRLAEPLYDPSPSLEIIDELHMLREELGTFDGHYESALANIQRQLTARQRADGRGVRMKVIASTATIKGEDRQCEHLFGLRSVVMPLPSPSLSSSFYWDRDESAPLRRFVGIQPQRLTAEMALVRILTAFHRAVRELERTGPAADRVFEGISPDRFATMLDLYRVSLTYVTSLVDFGKLRRSMDTQVNEALRSAGMPALRVEELSSDTAAKGVDRIRNIVDDLARPGGDIDAVVATSMVSHGVDINRLNVMVFNGMPKSMAEYIQASSRVGREFLGIVFMIFNPVRERDRSHYRYHSKFHEYLDRMVEPVAINRWSRYAARKTLPGVLMSQILQVLNREWWDKGRGPQHLHDLSRMQAALRPLSSGGLKGAQRDAMVEAIDDAFLVARDAAAELRSELPARVETALSSIRAAGAGGTSRGNGRFVYRGTGDHLGLEYEPMTSLRDVEEAIPFFILQERRRSR